MAAGRGYRYRKPRQLIAPRDNKKYGWLLSLSGSRMTQEVRTLYELLKELGTDEIPQST